jgi:hypothetical protein
MDVVYVDEGTAESVELRPKGVNDVEDKVVKVFFFELSVQPGRIVKYFSELAAQCGSSPL